LILTSEPEAVTAAAWLATAKVRAVVVPSEAGAVAVLDDPAERAAHDGARRLSSALTGAPVVLVRRGPSEDPGAADVQVTAHTPEGEIPAPAPGLVLANLPVVVEDLLLGLAEPREVSGAVDSAALSGGDALRTVAKAARAARAARRAGRSKRRWRTE
jgi:hypothetical protein